MKTCIKTTATGSVCVAYDDQDDERVFRLFTCPISGGYVREILDSGDARQVCESLGFYGSTLWVSSRDRLEALIRREFKSMRASEKRAMYA